ncbi:ATP-binding protein [Roseomonas stagni]|uniref:ATP-binding protein n=1 Tax=Falsiroseomonas algicola TaxID=2716930 RepID=A0A6M1LP03_9PROT|nr:ATP-binding protein [Falsiroseomonas algicola]
MSTIARIQTFAFSGVEALPVEVQVQIAPGLPAFLVVGLPDKAVGESRERVRAALTAIGLSLPPKRVLVNMAPADLAKEGSHFDLPIALGVLAAMEILPRDELADFAALGELALDGTLAPVAGVLPAAMAASARELGLVCPERQGPEAAWAGRIQVLAPPDLPALINHFRGTQTLSAPSPPRLDDRVQAAPCLSEVRGQESAKRALEIAAAGGHNLLLIGTVDPTASALARARVGVLVGCRWCGTRTALCMDRAVALGMGVHPVVRLWRACSQCGRGEGDLAFIGDGWTAGPVRVPLAAPVRVPMHLARPGEVLPYPEVGAEEWADDL